MRDGFTHELIIDAAMDIIHGKGTQLLTMEQLAKQAGVAKGTLYLYFRNKTEVVKAAVDRIFLPLMEDLDDIFSSNFPLEKRLERMIRAQLHFFDERINLFRILMQDREAPSYCDSPLNDGSPYWIAYENTKQLIDEGIQLERFRPVDTTQAAIGLIETTLGRIFLNLMGRSVGTIDQQVKTIMDILLHGIASKGATCIRTK